MVAKLLLLLLLVSINANASSKCARLISGFMKSGKEIQVFHYPESKYHQATIQAEYRSIEVGLLNYSELKKSLHIELVMTNPNFRREGIQTVLINRLVKLKEPKRITLHFGETNKDVFLHSAFDELFNHMVSIKSRSKMVESYLAENIYVMNNQKLSRSAFNTPTGKALYNAGFHKVHVILSTYLVAGRDNIRIALKFERGQHGADII